MTQNADSHWRRISAKRIKQYVKGGLSSRLATKLAMLEIQERKKLTAIAGIKVATMAIFDVQAKDGRLKPRFMIFPGMVQEKERGDLAKKMRLGGARYT